MRAVRGVRGITGGVQGNEGAAKQGRGGARAASTRPPAYWQEVEDGAAAGLGQLQCWAIWWAGRWAVPGKWPGTSLSLSLS